MTALVFMVSLSNSSKKISCKIESFYRILAEGVRFELTVGMTPSLVFKTSSINRSDNPPNLGDFQFLVKSLEQHHFRNQ